MSAGDLLVLGVLEVLALGFLLGRLERRRRRAREASIYALGFDDGRWRGPAMRRARP